MVCDYMPVKRFILENELPSGLYICLLGFKDGINQYQLAKEYYHRHRRQIHWSPNKVYPILEELKKLELISKEEKKGSKRETNIVKPNLKKFTEVLSDTRLPEGHKFVRADIEDIADLLEKLDLYNSNIWSTLPKETAQQVRSTYARANESKEFGVLDRTAITLKTGVFLVNKFPNWPDKSNVTAYKYVKQFKKLNDDLKSKLMYLTVPEPIEIIIGFMDYMLEFKPSNKQVRPEKS